MYRYIIIISFFFHWLDIYTLNAQNIRKIQRDLVELSDEDNLKIAHELYDQGKYYSAIYHFKKIIQNDTFNYYCYYQIGNSYRMLRLYNKAADHYKKVIDLKSANFPLVNYWYGKMLKANGKYDEAKISFEEYIKNYKGDGRSENKNTAREEIKRCEYVKILSQNPVARVVNLDSTVNKHHSDFSVVEINEKKILFTGTDQINVSEKRKLTGAIGKLDIVYINRLFEAQMEGGKWQERILIDITPKSELWNIGNPAFSMDGKRLYYTICKNIETGTDCKIYYSVKEEMPKIKWSKPKILGKEVNEPEFSSKHPMLTADINNSEVLFFTSNRPGSTGGFDIWFCKIDSNQKLAIPINLGSKINTKYDEGTPFYDQNNNRLFFSSNGHLGLGEFDIFVAKMDQEEKTGRVYNVGYPINSSADDYYFYLSPFGRKGYISSNRLGGHSENEGTCCDDIYTFEFNPAFKFKKLTQQLSEVSLFDEDDPAFAMFNESFTKVDNPISISGTLTLDKKVSPNTLVVIVNERGEIVDSTISDENGFFEFKRLPGGHSYMVMLDEEDAGMEIFMEFKDKKGEVLKTVNSEEDKVFFNSENQEIYRIWGYFLNIQEYYQATQLAILKDKDDSELILEEGDFTISGTLTQDKKAASNTLIILVNEKGEVVDSTISDELGFFEFKQLPGGQTYMVMLDEEDSDMEISMEFRDNEGEVLKTVTSKEDQRFFKYENLKIYATQIAMLAEDDDPALILEEGDLTISGTLTQDKKVASNTLIILVNEKGEVVDSTISDEHGFFEFKQLPGGQTYMVMLDEEDSDMEISMEFRDKEGEVLKTVTSKEDKRFFKYENLEIYATQLAMLAEEDDSELILEEGKVLKSSISTITRYTIFFEKNSFALSISSKEKLYKLVEILKENSEKSIRICGFTDITGDKQYNQKLSELRAKTVYDHLISTGEDGEDGKWNKEKLSYKGYGIDKPIASNNTEQGRAKNRRVEFIIH